VRRIRPTGCIFYNLNFLYRDSIDVLAHFIQPNLGALRLPRLQNITNTAHSLIRENCCAHKFTKDISRLIW
jgi:hypothetical protein